MRFTRNQKAIADGFKYADIKWLWIVSFYWFEVAIIRINRRPMASPPQENKK